jgi:hypothetical protein
MGAAGRTCHELLGKSAAACSELGLCARSEPQSDCLGRLRIAPILFQLRDGRIEVPLQVIEVREPASNITFDPSAPALHEPEVQPPKVESVRCQLAQGNADRATPGTMTAKENARSEFVSTRTQATSHCAQEFVGQMPERPTNRAG